MVVQRRAMFLDRDGVLIRTFVREGVAHPPDTMDELEILPGVPEALGMLAANDYLLVVATNQPDVARGTQTRDAVEEMNAALTRHLPLDAIYVCFHDAGDHCACRKPAPGLLIKAAQKHGIDLNQSFMIGDRGSDVLAGNSAGCRTFLVDRPYSRCDRIKPDFKVADLMEAAQIVLADAA